MLTAGWRELGHDDTRLILLLMCGLGAGGRVLGWAAGTHRTAAGTNIFSSGIFEHTHASRGPIGQCFHFHYIHFTFTITNTLVEEPSLSLCAVSLHPPVLLWHVVCRGSDVNPIDNPGVRTAGHYARIKGSGGNI